MFPDSNIPTLQYTDALKKACNLFSEAEIHWRKKYCGDGNVWKYMINGWKGIVVNGAR